MDLIYGIFAALVSVLFAPLPERVQVPPPVLAETHEVVGDSSQALFGTVESASGGTVVRVYDLDGRKSGTFVVPDPGVLIGLRNGRPFVITRPQVEVEGERSTVWIHPFLVKNGIALKGRGGVVVSVDTGQWTAKFPYELHSVWVDEDTGAVFVLHGQIDTTTASGTRTHKLAWPDWMLSLEGSVGTNVPLARLSDGRLVFEAHCPDTLQSASSKVPAAIPLVGQWTPGDPENQAYPFLGLLCLTEPLSGKVQVLAAERRIALAQASRKSPLSNVATSGGSRIVWSMDSGIRVFTPPVP